MQIYPLFFMRFFIIFKKEKYWHYNDSVRPIINFLLIIGLLFIGICWRYLNMNSYKHLKNVLFHNIKNLSDVCSIFCVNPDTDFTRNRKLDFETTMKIVLCMGASPIQMSFLNSMTFLLLHLLLLPLSRLEARLSLKHSGLCLTASTIILSRKSYIMVTGYWPLMAVNSLLIIPSLMMKQRY